MLLIFKATYRLICGRPIQKSEHELKKISRTIKHNVLPYHCLALKSKLANPDVQVIYKTTTGLYCRNPSARPRMNSKNLLQENHFKTRTILHLSGSWVEKGGGRRPPLILRG